METGPLRWSTGISLIFICVTVSTMDALGGGLLVVLCSWKIKIANLIFDTLTTNIVFVVPLVLWLGPLGVCGRVFGDDLVRARVLLGVPVCLVRVFVLLLLSSCSSIVSKKSVYQSKHDHVNIIELHL